MQRSSFLFIFLLFLNIFYIMFSFRFCLHRIKHNTVGKTTAHSGTYDYETEHNEAVRHEIMWQ